MGAGAVFLAMEARAQLENGTSKPEFKPKILGLPSSENQEAIDLVWHFLCGAGKHDGAWFECGGYQYWRTFKKKRG
jgi:hypothetical protein